jgi:hypothetical protein
MAALRNAAARTGSDFGYLLGTAMRESSLDSTAQARTSSASGLFQFTDNTWLATVKAHGAEYGLGRYADAIHANGGHYTVDSPAVKSQILALRNDPQTAAFMAGEAAADIKQSLEGSLCRPVTCGELYAAHFLGEAGARKLITLNESNPSASAADAFPQAARANHKVFYHADGTPKSVADVYAWAVRLPNAPQAAGAGVGAGVGTPAGAIALGPMDIASSEDDGRPGVGAYQAQPATSRYVAYAPSSTSSIGSLLPQAPLMLMPGILEILASMNATLTPRERAN